MGEEDKNLLDVDFGDFSDILNLLNTNETEPPEKSEATQQTNDVKQPTENLSYIDQTLKSLEEQSQTERFDSETVNVKKEKIEDLVQILNNLAQKKVGTIRKTVIQEQPRFRQGFSSVQSEKKKRSNKFANVIIIIVIVVGFGVWSSNHSTENSQTKTNSSVNANNSDNKEATADAEGYLQSGSFSEKKLIDQLEYEGYTKATATYAVNHAKANWNNEALEFVQGFADDKELGNSSKSFYSLLDTEEFTKAQSDYAMAHLKVDWNNEALKAAKSLKNGTPTLSNSEIENMLSSSQYGSGFSKAQAAYAVEHLK